MTIVIANQKGGVGKSTIASNLAAILAARNKETLLIDHDSSHVSMNFFRRRIYHDDLAPFHTVVAKDYDDMVELLELEREMTVVDLGGFTDDLARAALVYSDLVLVPTSTSTQDMDGNIHFMEKLQQLKDAGLEINAAYIANNTDPRMKQPRIAEELNYITDEGYNIMTTIPHYAVFSASHGAGMSVVEFDKDSKAAAAMNTLVDKVLEAQNGNK